MAFIHEYGLFFAKTVTLLLAFAALLLLLLGAGRSRGGRREAHLELRRLNDRYRDMVRRIDHGLAKGRRANRALNRQERRDRKLEARSGARLPRLYVLDFHGDMRASAVDSLREEISAVLAAARRDDEVLVRLESPGGLVHSYGLAASQLARLRERGIRLTVSVDRVAASGGYLMASVADYIVAAPFAIVGSIGVVAQLPNLNRFLKKHDVDFEMHTAGEYKRTLTLFGENTDEGRAKFRDTLEETHEHFKAHLARYRPALDVAAVATGEYWLGERARELGLVDDIGTSDDFLLERRDRMDLVSLTWRRREGIARRVSLVLESTLAAISRGAAGR
ncbi:MAG TPA: protease SohB [Gammaproteobacteria bacterium]|nr:protease SohB [Gammaproteobacteria bacterium]